MKYLIPLILIIFLTFSFGCLDIFDAKKAPAETRFNELVLKMDSENLVFDMNKTIDFNILKIETNSDDYLSRVAIKSLDNLKNELNFSYYFSDVYDSNTFVNCVKNKPLYQKIGYNCNFAIKDEMQFNSYSVLSKFFGEDVNSFENFDLNYFYDSKLEIFNKARDYNVFVSEDSECVVLNANSDLNRFSFGLCENNNSELKVVYYLELLNEKQFLEEQDFFETNFATVKKPEAIKIEDPFESSPYLTNIERISVKVNIFDPSIDSLMVKIIDFDSNETKIQRTDSVVIGNQFIGFPKLGDNSKLYNNNRWLLNSINGNKATWPLVKIEVCSSDGNCDIFNEVHLGLGFFDKDKVKDANVDGGACQYYLWGINTVFNGGKSEGDKCYEYFAIVNEDPNLCTFVKDKVVKDICYSEVARWTNNKEICEKVESEEYKKSCISNAIN